MQNQIRLWFLVFLGILALFSLDFDGPDQFGENIRMSIVGEEIIPEKLGYVSWAEIKGNEAITIVPLQDKVVYVEQGEGLAFSRYANIDRESRLSAGKLLVVPAGWLLVIKHIGVQPLKLTLAIIITTSEKIQEVYAAREEGRLVGSEPSLLDLDWEIMKNREGKLLENTILDLAQFSQGSVEIVDAISDEVELPLSNKGYAAYIVIRGAALIASEGGGIIVSEGDGGISFSQSTRTIQPQNNSPTVVLVFYFTPTED